jgi:hypothetical protein
VTIALLAACFALFVIFAMTPPGGVVVGKCRWFLEYYSGVFSLVALSLTVMVGILATDRLVLLIQHRVLLQAIHRATAIAAVGFLAIHIAMKVMEGHASVVDVAIPFLASHRATFVGLGTIAMYLMVIAAWTGVVRARFADSTRPWLWRAVHSCAYLCWPIALVHGLKSGRPAAGWVVASYAICLILVFLSLLVRLSVKWGRRLQAPKASTTSAIPRVPSAVSTRVAPQTTTAWRPAASGISDLADVDVPPTTSRAVPAEYGARPHRVSPPPPTPRVGQASRVGPAPTVAPRPPSAPHGRSGRIDPSPPPAPRQRRSLQHASDDEFWDFMRGDE